MRLIRRGTICHRRCAAFTRQEPAAVVLSEQRDHETVKGPDGVPNLQLTITGGDPPQRRQMDLKQNETTRIGRAPPDGITWDLAISRQHADLCWDGKRLRVTCLAAARNPIVYQGESVRETIVRPGESFFIGKTRFQCSTTPEPPPPGSETVQMFVPKSRTPELGEHTYSERDLQQVEFRNKEQQLEVLARLPNMISESQSDTDLGQMLSGLLMGAIPQAEAVAVAHYDMEAVPQDEESIDDFPQPLTKRVRTREDFVGRFRPSRRIIQKTLHEQKSVLHIWPPDASSADFTSTEGLGWAVCVPIRGDACHGWCMYVSGKGARDGGMLLSEADLASDLRFTELVAQFIGSVRQVRTLQEQKTRLSSFFSPKIIDSLTSQYGRKALSPAERNITVLFCDVRGFSRKSEQLQDDLLPLLRSVSAALGVMVKEILKRDGAIADFQGDAALGFWGWPVALEYGPIPACRAAIGICNGFLKAAEQTGSLLDGFSVGIGISYGRAVAGQIGTEEQSKIGVFGPVVNQGARLESMTKQFGVSICIDGPTAEFVDRYLPVSEGRLRRLACVRPQGMAIPLDVYGLLPPEDDHSPVSQQMISDHESALEAVIAGQWDDAIDQLAQLPDSDGPKKFLIRHMSAFDNAPPPDWDGVFSLSSK